MWCASLDVVLSLTVTSPSPQPTPPSSALENSQRPCEKLRNQSKKIRHESAGLATMMKGNSSPCECVQGIGRDVQPAHTACTLLDPKQKWIRFVSLKSLVVVPYLWHYRAEMKFHLEQFVQTHPLGPGMRSFCKAPMYPKCLFRCLDSLMAISRLVGPETSIYLISGRSLFATSMDQEHARWHLSYSIGLLSTGKVDVTLAAFGGEPKDCAAFPVVFASPEDGCAPLRNTQQVRGRSHRRARTKEYRVLATENNNFVPERNILDNVRMRVVGRAGFPSHRARSLHVRLSKGAGSISPRVMASMAPILSLTWLVLARIVLRCPCARRWKGHTSWFAEEAAAFSQRRSPSATPAGEAWWLSMRGQAA